MTERETPAILVAIAKKHLHLETLEMRCSDSLDFSDQNVTAIKRALEEAYAAGQMSISNWMSSHVARSTAVPTMAKSSAVRSEEGYR